MTHTEIENHFINIKSINEAKKVYKTLAKQLHPDIGGDTESFKMLNSMYTYLIEHKIYFSSGVKIDIELEKIISLILHFENITIELVGSWCWVSNVNYTDKVVISKLKELGFKWASKKKMWHFSFEKSKNGGKTKSMNEIKNKYGYTEVKTKGKKYYNLTY